MIDWPATIGATIGKITVLALIIWLINYFLKLHRGE
jgi:hypothetical protein